MISTREEALFTAALERPPAERAAFLDGACLGDAGLRARVESLLASHDATANPLATRADPGPTIRLQFAEAPDEAVGQTLGRYKLLEQLGEGGCGVVYVVEQTEPVRRRVAVKVIKLGMDTKSVVARFEAERQALALMDHPNIAKVLDAGTTDKGRPYFVMELVRGIRITDYCYQNHLAIRDRLELFIKVCQAIQHAHQKGIIHRDIKPSNILVTLHDGVPVPKVIDFGIAKATEGRLTDATVYTQLHQFIGTPAYMSPEQAEMSGLDIDTRSDIYSLGVLLYELLTGVTPFDGKELMASGIDGMRRTIREKEPARPSTRLTQIAETSAVSPSPIPHSRFPSDLDWIAMKCLEKDRTRRYETANGLAADINRHLDNEPVVARPPSTAYRFQKAFSRNKLAFAAGAAVAAALVVGALVASWQAVSAIRARNQAVQAEQREAEQRQTAEAAGRLAEANAREAITNAFMARSALYDSLVRQARALRMARQVGYREEVFELLRRARDLDTPARDLTVLRHEAVANMGDFLGFRPRPIASSTAGPGQSQMAVSPDGRSVAFNESAAVRLHELPSGRELGRWTNAGLGECRGLAFNAVGDRLFSLQRPWGDSASDHAVVTEYSLHSHRGWDRLTQRNLPGALAVLPRSSGMTIALAETGAGMKTIRLEDWGSGALVQRFQRTEGAWLPNMALSLDGSKLAVNASTDPEVEIFDVPSANSLHRFNPGSGRNSRMAFSNDGHHLLALGQKATEVRDTTTWTVVDRFPGYADSWSNGSFLPGTPLVVVPRPQQNRFLIRNFERNETVAWLKGKQWTDYAAFTSNGDYLVAWYGTNIMLHSFAAVQEGLTLNGHPAAVTAVEYGPDGRFLASVAKDRTIRLWEADSGELVWKGERDLPGLGQTVDFSPDGRLLATGCYDTPKVDLWDARTGRHLRQLLSADSSEFTWSLRFTRHPDGWLLWQGRSINDTTSPGLVIWQLKSSEAVLNEEPGAVGLRAIGAVVKGMVVSPASRHIAYTESPLGGTTSVRILDPLRREASSMIAVSIPSVQALGFTPDGDALATLNPAGKIMEYEVATGRVRRSFPVSGGDAYQRGMALSPTGRWLAVNSPSNLEVDIHDYATGELLYTLPEREGTVYWLAWHPTAPRLAVARDNGDITLWDLAKVDQQLEALGLGLSSAHTSPAGAKP